MKKPICYVDGRKVDNKDVEVLLTQECVDFLFMPCWKSMIKIPEEIVETVFRVCTEIETKDETFKFKIIPSYKPDVKRQRCKLLVIYSPTRDQAYRRAGWIVSKFGLKSFNRLEKGYYWVEEYPAKLHVRKEGALLPEP